MSEMSPEEFARSKLSSEDRKTFDAMCRARDNELEAERYKDKSDPTEENNRQGDKKRAKDGAGGSYQQTLEGEQTGNALDELRGKPMNTYSIARKAASIAADEMHELRVAESEMRRYVGDMAFDSAFRAYRSGLEAVRR